MWCTDEEMRRVSRVLEMVCTVLPAHVCLMLPGFTGVQQLCMDAAKNTPDKPAVAHGPRSIQVTS